MGSLCSNSVELFSKYFASSSFISFCTHIFIDQVSSAMKLLSCADAIGLFSGSVRISAFAVSARSNVPTMLPANGVAFDENRIGTPSISNGNECKRSYQKARQGVPSRVRYRDAAAIRRGIAMGWWKFSIEMAPALSAGIAAVLWMRASLVRMPDGPIAFIHPHLENAVLDVARRARPTSAVSLLLRHVSQGIPPVHTFKKAE
jgi:hypothetical protein